MRGFGRDGKMLDIIIKPTKSGGSDPFKKAMEWSVSGQKNSHVAKPRVGSAARHKLVSRIRTISFIIISTILPSGIHTFYLYPTLSQPTNKQQT